MLYSCTHMATVGVKGLNSDEDRQTERCYHHCVYPAVGGLCYSFPLSEQQVESSVTLFYQLGESVEHFTVDEVYKPWSIINTISIIINCVTVNELEIPSSETETMWSSLSWPELDSLDSVTDTQSIMLQVKWKTTTRGSVRQWGSMRQVRCEAWGMKVS